MGNIWFPIISFFSALLGAILTALIAFRNDVKKSTLERQRESYINFIDCLQDVMDEEVDSTPKLINSRNKILTFGSNATLEAVNEFVFDIMVENQKIGKIPDKITIENSQDRIIRSMRKDIGVSRKFSFYKNYTRKLILIRFKR